MLTLPNVVTASWYSTSSEEGGPTASISIFVLDNALTLSYVVTNPYTDEKRNYSIDIPIVHVLCNYGGVRLYFTCPECSRRVFKALQAAVTSAIFMPSLLELTYQSCQDSGDAHARTRALTVKICRKLGIKEYGKFIL